MLIFQCVSLFLLSLFFSLPLFTHTIYLSIYLSIYLCIYVARTLDQFVANILAKNLILAQFYSKNGPQKCTNIWCNFAFGVPTNLHFPPKGQKRCFSFETDPKCKQQIGLKAMYVYIYIYISLSLSLSLSRSLSLYLSLHLSLHLSLSLYLSISLSLSLPLCLSLSLRLFFLPLFSFFVLSFFTFVSFLLPCFFGKVFFFNPFCFEGFLSCLSFKSFLLSFFSYLKFCFLFNNKVSVLNNDNL